MENHAAIEQQQTPRSGVRSGRVASSWRAAMLPAAACALAGAFFAWFPAAGDPIGSIAYDVAQRFQTRPAPADVVIVHVDEQSFRAFNQAPKNWDRRLYAGLIDHLTREGARLVALDVWLSDDGPPESDQELARAIRANGRVVLAAKREQTHRADIRLATVLKPREPFASAAAAWGITEVIEDSVIRRYYQGTAGQPSLPWAAAVVAATNAAFAGGETDVSRWLNYYGPPGTLFNVSFAQATNQTPGFYRDKCVFIGSRPKALYPDDQPDEFRTPHPLDAASGGKMPGVEIMATGFLNLVDGTALRRMPPATELAWAVVLGIVAGSGLMLVRPGAAAVLAIVGMLAVGGGGLTRTWLGYEWSAWTVPVLVQIPLALGCSWLAATRRWRLEKADLEGKLLESVGGAGAIPDHTLVRRIGRGGYGEVWLARNATGIFRAVKIVRRRWFQNDHHYGREFEGIRKFLPAAGSHPGLVQILQVGRRDVHGYFYYIMELGDDMASGQNIDPDRYTPVTLAQVLLERGRLPANECRDLGISLADALDHLHTRQLIHRDIKPANILFVQGRPKLADIGLVTALASPDAVSRVGTPDYVAPEGPGAAADVYALGLVLYQATTGMDVQSYPELPTSVYDAPDYACRKHVIEIIAQACAHRVEDRFRSPGALREALLALPSKDDLVSSGHAQA